MTSPFSKIPCRNKSEGGPVTAGSTAANLLGCLAPLFDRTDVDVSLLNHLRINAAGNGQAERHARLLSNHQLVEFAVANFFRFLFEGRLQRTRL